MGFGKFSARFDNEEKALGNGAYMAGVRVNL